MTVSCSHSFFLAWINAVLELKIQDFLLSFIHFVVKGFKGRFKHADGFFEILLGLFDVVLDEDASHNFPAFPFALEWLQIIEN